MEIDGFLVGDDQLYLSGESSAYTAIPLPAGTELNGYDTDLSGVYFSVDVTSLIEGVTVEPRDVARWDGSSVSLAIDGSAEGIPNGARVDAVMAADASGIFISLDTSANVAGLNVDDEDLFRVASPLLLFDGSEDGIDPSLDLNGATLLANTAGLFSFDGSGSVSGFDFDDEDLLEYDSTTGNFTLHTDGSAISPNLTPVDVTAVPEPAFVVALGVASAGMAAAGVRRRRMR